MSDHDALLAAILAEPAEDMPRLLLAEWLDENAGTVECGNCGGEKEVPVTRHHGKEFMGFWTTTHREPCPTCSGTGRVSDGRAERAEFIRVQCELAQLNIVDRTCPDIDDYGNRGPRWKEGVCQCRGCVLRRRERELLEKSYACELYLGFDGGPWTDFVWSRGFISSLTLTWAAWREHADAILRAQPVELVKLTTMPGRGWCGFDYRGAWTGDYSVGIIPWAEGEYPVQLSDPDLPSRKLIAAMWPRITFELPAERITRGVMITLPEGYIVSDPSYAHVTAPRTRPQRVDEPQGIPPVSPG